jgi:hypothetical protein
MSARLTGDQVFQIRCALAALAFFKGLRHSDDGLDVVVSQQTAELTPAGREAAAGWGNTLEDSIERVGGVYNGSGLNDAILALGGIYNPLVKAALVLRGLNGGLYQGLPSSDDFGHPVNELAALIAVLELSALAQEAFDAILERYAPTAFPPWPGGVTLMGSGG